MAEARTVAEPSSRVRAPTGLNEAGLDMPASRRSEQAGGDLPPSPRVSVAAALGNMGEVEVRVVPSRSGLKQDASVTATPASARPPSAMAVGAPGLAEAPSRPLAERGALGETEGQAVATVAAAGRPPAPTTPPWKVVGPPVDTGAGATGAVAAAPVARGSFVQAAAPEGEPANAGAPAPHSEPGAEGQETRTRAAAIREAGTMGPAPAATAVTGKLLSAEQAMAIGGGDAEPGGETGSRGSDGEPMPLGADAPSRAGAPTQLVQGPDAARANTVVRQIAEAAGLTTDGGVEVSLSPEELGRVKLTMTPQEAGLAITILAERAETLELLRRHIDVLARDLADQGFTSLSFDFGQAGDEAGGQAGGGGLDDLARGTAEPPARAGRESLPSGSHQSGLDLRL